MSAPVDPLLPELRRALERERNVVLQAAPGAGKTTRVPPALLGSRWLGQKKILMLEPRRLAARAAARHMAYLRGERVGGTVGYRMRLDARVGPTTRIEVVTEGILTRRLQRDPELADVGLVIFDEFHERNLQCDLGLALCLDIQASLRDDLRLLIMSATLDIEAVAGALGTTAVLSSPGTSLPVDVCYRPLGEPYARNVGPFCDAVAHEVYRALRRERGSALVFLPGTGEIRRVASTLRSLMTETDIHIVPLHGQLDARAQDEAIRPAPPEYRKVVLATSIAETSLTIEGIRIVVDAGLTRRPRFDPKTALTRLTTDPVSRDASDQRRGRAGRLEPGVCYRLWPEHKILARQSTPEILEADLAPMLLELTAWGVRDPQELLWMDTPPAAHIDQARGLLGRLGALDDDGRITSHGRAMARLGAHPRLAHMMLRGVQLGHGALACALAALLSERDPLRSTVRGNADVALRLELMIGKREVPPGETGLVRRLRATAARWGKELGIPNRITGGDIDAAGLLLAFAYPDRVAGRRPGPGDRYLLSSGQGARLPVPQPLGRAPYLVAAHVAGTPEAVIHLAAGIHREDLLAHHPVGVSERPVILWDAREQAVRARIQRRMGALLLDEAVWTSPPGDRILATLLDGIRQAGPACLPWTPDTLGLRERLQFLHRLDRGRWPDCSDAGLLSDLDEWLGPWLTGLSRLAHMKRVGLRGALLARIPWEQRASLDDLAPESVTLPNGVRVRIDYGSDPPVLAARVQQFFGLTDTPCVAGGRVALQLHLLSPAHRPVQITQDLAAFWTGSYHAVRKDMKGRYPKHDWPDDPWHAKSGRGPRKDR